MKNAGLQIKALVIYSCVCGCYLKEEYTSIRHLLFEGVKVGLCATNSHHVSSQSRHPHRHRTTDAWKYSSPTKIVFNSLHPYLLIKFKIKFTLEVFYWCSSTHLFV